MKTLLLLLLLAPCLRAAGQASPLPPQKATVVVVQTPDSAAVALRKLAMVFVAQGYTVDKLDREFLTLTLTPKLVSNYFSPVLSAKAVATPGANSTLRVSGTWRATILNQPLVEPASCIGRANGVSRVTFAELQQVAHAYPSGKVSYSFQ